MTRPTPLMRSDFRVHTAMPTRWFDNDVYSHMNNTVHYLLFDTAVNGFLMQHGILKPTGGATILLVVESGCSYFSEMAFPDVITVGLSISKLGSSSVRYQIGLFREDAETAAAQGHFVHVNVDRQARRPIPIPDAARATLSTLCQPS